MPKQNNITSPVRKAHLKFMKKNIKKQIQNSPDKCNRDILPIVQAMWKKSPERREAMRKKDQMDSTKEAAKIARKKAAMKRKSATKKPNSATKKPRSATKKPTKKPRSATKESKSAPRRGTRVRNPPDRLDAAI